MILLSTTTMKNLLTQIKTVFLNARNAIGCDHYKRGILPPLMVYPSVALLPNTETIIELRSGGQYVIQRDVAIEVYTKHLKPKIALDQLKNIVRGIVDVCQTQNLDNTSTWQSISFDCTWGTEVYETPFEVQNQIIQVATIPMTFLSHETIPSGRTPSATVTETGQSSVVTNVYDTLVSYIDASDTFLDLTNVRRIYEKEIPTVPQYPAITVVGRGIDRGRTYAGMDVPMHNIELSVFTKLLDKEWSLDQNLDIIEVLKDVVQYNNQWGGRCEDTMITSVQYDRADIGGLGLTYRSRIFCNAEGHEIING